MVSWLVFFVLLIIMGILYACAVYFDFPNSKVAASLGEHILCRIGMHQGTWTTEGCSGCWQRRFCIYCGVPQKREVHDWPWGVYEYFMDGSCKTRMTCLRCGKTKFTGKKHVGAISWSNTRCARCGKELGKDLD